MSDEIYIKGLNFALLKSNVQTTGGADRYIQPLVESGRKADMSLLRTVSSADGADISGLSGWTHGIAINDETIIVCQLRHASSVGVARITPIAIDASDNIFALDTKERGVGSTFAITDGEDYYSPIAVWNILGATEVFLLISWLASGDTVKIYGGLL